MFEVSPDELSYLVLGALVAAGFIVLTVWFQLKARRYDLWQAAVHEAGHALYAVHHESELQCRFQRAEVNPTDLSRSLVHSDPIVPVCADSPEFDWYHGVMLFSGLAAERELLHATSDKRLWRRLLNEVGWRTRLSEISPLSTDLVNAKLHAATLVRKLHAEGHVTLTQQHARLVQLTGMRLPLPPLEQLFNGHELVNILLFTQACSFAQSHRSDIGLIAAYLQQNRKIYRDELRQLLRLDASPNNVVS